MVVVVLKVLIWVICRVVGKVIMGFVFFNKWCRWLVVCRVVFGVESFFFGKIVFLLIVSRILFLDLIISWWVVVFRFILMVFGLKNLVLFSLFR